MISERLCACHGERMYWYAQKFEHPNGYYICRVKRLANVLAFKRTEKGRALQRAFNASPKGRARKVRYLANGGKIVGRRARLRRMRAQYVNKLKELEACWPEIQGI